MYGRLVVVGCFAALLVGGTALAGKGGVEQSYHGQLGRDTGMGMLEKWCALPNFSFEQQGGIDGWTTQSCNGCHIGAAWNPTLPTVDCQRCHGGVGPGVGLGVGLASPTPEKCLTCHVKDSAKRGDVFTAEADVHFAAGMICQDCHARRTDPEGISDHQFLKGTTIDTTEPTMQGTLDCQGCHGGRPHVSGFRALRLNEHVAKVACETCHTGLRPADALASRSWIRFTETGKPVTLKRTAGWLPRHKWYDNTGPGESGDYHLPILDFTERRDVKGAKIYPFNAVSVEWYVKTYGSDFDDVIIVPEVKSADADGDRTVTLEEIQALYPDATLRTADMNFNVSHSIVPTAQAFECKDCHGRRAWVLDWTELGYEADPRR